MDRMIYLSMNGAKASMQRQDTLANNLANVSTTGFRAELQAFRSVMAPGGAAGTRAFAMETTAGYDNTPGPVATTGRRLDVAVRGESWLSVQALDGSEAYTRAGSLDLSADGTLVTRSGLQVLGDGGPIQLPANSEPSIASDGSVSARLPNGTSSVVGRLKLVTPETRLERGSDGLFRSAGGDPLEADPAARLQDGALEGSNVNPVECMVAMIAAARQFEAQMKMMQTAEADGKAAVQLLAAN